MKQIAFLLGLAGFAICGSLNNEYLPPNTGVIASRQFTGSFGQHGGSSFGSNAPTSRFGSSRNTFGSSFRPSSQYGVPSLNRQFGGQYSPASQYSRPAAPSSLYGAPSQYSSSPKFEHTSSFSSGSQFRQAVPSAQYGAPSAFGQQQRLSSSYPTQYSSQFSQNHGISRQYGAPQQYQSTHFSQPASFRSGPQFGGVSSSFQGGASSGYRPSVSAYSSTIQDSNGGYVY